MGLQELEQFQLLPMSLSAILGGARIVRGNVFLDFSEFLLVVADSEGHVFRNRQYIIKHASVYWGIRGQYGLRELA